MTLHASNDSILYMLQWVETFTKIQISDVLHIIHTQTLFESEGPKISSDWLQLQL